MSCQLYPERSAGGGGGVSGELGDLSNVNISSVQNGQIISYNSSLGVWVNSANAGGGGGGGAQTGDNVSIFINDTGYVTLGDLGSAATTDSTAYATSAQGLLADSSIQPSDNISVLTNDTGYVTLGDLGSAATTDSTAYATSAQGLLADAALQSGDLNPVLFSSQGNFPAASTVHGAIAHSHSDGAMYFAHNSVWNKLANYSDLSSVAGSVTSVAGKTGDVTLSSTDVSGLGTAATTNSGDYATSAQGLLASSAVQSGDNISLLSNDVGYITDAGEAPVQSVAGKTGAVSLDYNDIVGLGDIVTTNSGDYATSSEGSLAVTALQPSDNISALNNDAGYLTGVATGTAAAFDVGTGANNIVQLDSSAKLPAVDGSQLTGLDLAFDSINDITITNPQVEDVVKYNGASWVNGQASVDIETPLTNALRGVAEPHIGAFGDQSFKVTDNPRNEVMVIVSEAGDLEFLMSSDASKVYLNTPSSRKELTVGLSVNEDDAEPDIEITSSDGKKISVISGDSDEKGANGLPMRQGFNNADIGANPSSMLISGGSID